ncbi:hypothetical protein BASA50_010219 [Batrachochytrium salamandrivorans]|uniref:Uncharacterized protein n=1 Tax=Batrachochytrium salamandrivorans TaxID=1357716 RepID=A0ABQ8EZ41_9FUNG|nr:hypothetical protein BASA50_010219 [Batrachochytrium salamandrivorans]
MAHQPQKSAPSVGLSYHVAQVTHLPQSHMAQSPHTPSLPRTTLTLPPLTDWPYLDEAQPIPSTTVTALSASAKIIDKLFEPLSDPQQTACEARGSFNTTFSNTDSASTSDKDTDSNDDPLTEFHHDDEHPTLEDRTSINPSMLEFESRLRMAGLRPVGVQSHNSLFRACAEVLLGNEKLYTLIKDDFLAHANRCCDRYQRSFISSVGGHTQFSQYMEDVFGPYANPTHNIDFFGVQILSDLIQRPIHVFKPADNNTTNSESYGLWEDTIYPYTTHLNSDSSHSYHSTVNHDPIRLGLFGNNQFIALHNRIYPGIKKNSSGRQKVHMFQDDPEKLKEMHIQEKSQKELDDEIRHGFFKGQQSLQEVTNTIPNIALIESGSASVDVSYMNLYNTRSSAEADVDARLGESQDIDFSHRLQNADDSELCFKTSKVWDGLDQSATSVQSDRSALGSSKLLQKILVNGEFSPRLQRSKCDGKPPVSMKPMETAPFVSDVGSFDELPHQRSIITHTANDPKTCLHDDSRDNQGRSEPHVPVVHLTQQYKNEYIESSASRDSNGSENSIDSEEFRQIQTAIENSLIDYRSLDRQGHLYLTDRNVGSSRSFAREENNDDIVSGLEDTSDCDEDLKKALAQSLMEYESSHGRQSMACWESGSVVDSKGKGRAE